MPELPDVTVYVEHLERRIEGVTLERVRLGSPFVLQSVTPPLSDAEGRRVAGVRRIGKRIVISLTNGPFLVVHLMIAGRLRWRPPGAALARRLGLAAFDFSTGTLVLTEAGTRKRASLVLAADEAALAALDPGGLEVLDASEEQFRTALARESHTLKRALTDPHLFSGIGNAYSDEILHRARLSPFKMTGQLTDEERARLYRATQDTLRDWIARLRAEAGENFPEKVTAFRPGMTAHGRFGQPCPVCGTAIQRIRYADNETNYCARCQTDGRLLADRALSRLLKSDWPRSIDEWDGR